MKTHIQQKKAVFPFRGAIKNICRTGFQVMYDRVKVKGLIIIANGVHTKVRSFNDESAIEHPDTALIDTVVNQLYSLDKQLSPYDKSSLPIRRR